MTNVCRNALDVLTSLVFPSLCLHCQKKSKNLFCQGCAGFFELIDPSNRCRYCFAQNENRAACLTCVKKMRWQLSIASALDYFEPVATLVKRLKYGKMPHLAKTAAAFMVVQHARMNWPEPDLIVPVPSRLWFRGTNHASLLASSVAQYFGKPWCTIVGRKPGDLSQGHLSQKQRENLSKKNFYLKQSTNVIDKTILLIDDVVATGNTLRHT